MYVHSATQYYMKKNFCLLVIAVPVPVLVKKMANTNKMFEIFSEDIKRKEKSIAMPSKFKMKIKCLLD